ncbi:MAG: gliding motility-associated ABC transporter substrate-binding protein GldG [Bacteroides sp.]|nr:gliding motility-associated ABC transporter substrate-binding protein GldG [Bacteroides sp.]
MKIFSKLNKPDPSRTSPARRDVKRRNIQQLLLGLAIILAVNALGTVKFARCDLTSEKRYSLTEGTRNMLRQLDDLVFFRVYLEGDFPAGFKRLRNQTREMLDEFRAYSSNVQYEFINPTESPEREGLMDMLVQKGLQPTQLQVRETDASSQQVIFPGALVSYRGKEVPLQLLQDQVGKPAEDVLNNSGQALEYNLANTIRQLTTEKKQKIAFLEGHGEQENQYIADIATSLNDFYQVERLRLDDNLEEILEYRTLIIAKPRIAFSEDEKYLLDQYIMQGGSMLWLVDPVFASMDSLVPPDFESIGMAWPLNLEDMLFRYGVRMNTDLLMDLRAAPIPVTTGMIGDRPQISLMPWYFFPLLDPVGDHKIVKNLNLVRSEFISSLDTVTAEGVMKTILLKTSPYTRVVPTPARVALDLLQQQPNEQEYAAGPQPVAALLEGNFQSVFRNRIIPAITLPEGFQARDESVPTAMIVVTDGDLIRNQFGQGGQPLPLGYDRYSGETFANRDFIMNAVNYLADDSGILEARVKDVRLRMLDRTRVNRDKIFIQLINLLVPVLLLTVFGILRFLWRKRRYAGKSL